ncbi:hypothetical protein BD779DRAFT_1431526 [Infundibulicybe gibba]|nr:hypothetical protein BD779DRAFT_1431526 [Infundibulicybe gibba]
MDPDILSIYLTELQLIQSSLLGGEAITILDPNAETNVWEQLLASFETGSGTPELINHHLAPPRIRGSLQNSNIWFEIDFPRVVANEAKENSFLGPPTVQVRGPDVTRADDERWKDVVNSTDMKYNFIRSYPMYQLISLQLFPLLHSHLAEHTQDKRTAVPVSPPQPAPHFHALFTSHHLIAPSKRRSLHEWSRSLSIRGFAKLGYPGIIYAQGHKHDVEEFVANVKGMQWLALKVRFVEEVEIGDTPDGTQDIEWKEFQKIGEVVEEMKAMGREEYVLSLGIGSSGSK